MKILKLKKRATFLVKSGLISLIVSISTYVIFNGPISISELGDVFQAENMIANLISSKTTIRRVIWKRLKILFL